MRSLRSDRGNTVIIAVFVLTLMMLLIGTVFSVTTNLTGSIKKTTDSQRAFQAADAGIDRALTRINALRPTAAQCVTDVVAAPTGGWCAATAPEALGQNSSFTYQVSSSASPVAQCGGVTLPAGSTGDRCVVSTGTANGVVRRVASRLAISTTATPFNFNTSLVGFKDVRVKKKAVVAAAISFNKKLTVEKDAILSSTVTRGPKGKIKGWTGTPTTLTSPLVPTLPDFAVYDPGTGTKRDSATWNDNASVYTPWASNPKVTYNATTRELVIGDGVNFTLPPGVYNFCKLTLGKNARVTIVPPSTGATVPLDAVRIFIDSRDRAGSRCTSAGSLDSKTNSSFVNPSPDPRTLQIFAWSKKTKMKVGNAVGFSGIIWAPMSKVKFNGKGKLKGGVSGSTIEVHKEMRIEWTSTLTTWTIPDAGISQVVSWRQCVTTGSLAQPYDGCPIG